MLHARLRWLRGGEEGGEALPGCGLRLRDRVVQGFYEVRDHRKNRAERHGSESYHRGPQTIRCEQQVGLPRAHHLAGSLAAIQVAPAAHTFADVATDGCCGGRFGRVGLRG